MRFIPLVTSFFWFLPVVLQPLIALVMLRRRLARQFPLFFSFNLLVPARDVALSFLPFSGDVYSAVYWYGEAAATALELGIIFENTWHFIRPYPFLRRFFRILGIVGIVAAISALIMLTWAKTPGGSLEIFDWIILTERSSRFLQVSLLVVALTLMSRLGLTWHSYALGIAAGFGVYATLDLVLLELRAHLHLVSDSTFVLLRSAAYNLGVAIWAYYFLRPQGGKPVDGLPATDLTEWNDAVTPHVEKWYRR